MTLLYLIDGGPVELLDAHLSYHLAAGVDLVLIPERLSDERVRAIARARGDSVRIVAVPDSVPIESDWVIRGGSHEFWWPRGGSLRELIAGIPEGFSAVQGLERWFARAGDDGRDYFERTIRRVLPGTFSTETTFVPGRPARRLLRRGAGSAGSAPAELRAWFPLEVLCFPGERQDAATDGTERAGQASVEDTRVRDALRRVAAAEALTFPRPCAPDDPHFALEVATVAELDVATASRRIDELEQRLAAARSRSLASRLRAGRRRVWRSPRGGTASS